MTFFAPIEHAKSVIEQHGPMDAKAIAKAMGMPTVRFQRRLHRLLLSHGADFGLIQQPDGAWAINQQTPSNPN